jgi:hypothetical protein
MSGAAVRFVLHALQHNSDTSSAAFSIRFCLYRIVSSEPRRIGAFAYVTTLRSWANAQTLQAFAVIIAIVKGTAHKPRPVMQRGIQPLTSEMFARSVVARNVPA